MGVQLRAAEAADIPQIAAIYAHAVRHETATFETEPPDAQEMLRRFELLQAGGYPYLVALEGEALRGYAHAGPYRPRPAYRFTVEDSVYLPAEARGRGIGRALLDQLISETGRRGFAEMVAVIGDSHNTASIRLHERLGFARVGTLHRVGFKFDRWIDSVMMQRSLNR